MQYQQRKPLQDYALKLERTMSHNRYVTPVASIQYPYPRMVPRLISRFSAEYLSRTSVSRLAMNRRKGGFNKRMTERVLQL